jgi:hypothetical protein
MRERFFNLGPIEQLADDEVIGIAITGDVGRDGDIWEPRGIDLSEYKRNPIVLRQHDPDAIVGTAVAIGLVDSNTIGVRIRFAPPGASAIADETRALATFRRKNDAPCRGDLTGVARHFLHERT